MQQYRNIVINNSNHQTTEMWVGDSKFLIPANKTLIAQLDQNFLPQLCKQRLWLRSLHTINKNPQQITKNVSESETPRQTIPKLQQ